MMYEMLRLTSKCKKQENASKTNLIYNSTIAFTRKPELSNGIGIIGVLRFISAPRRLDYFSEVKSNNSPVV